MKNLKHKWSPKLDNCKKLTLEDAKFFFEQAEKYLQDITDSHKSIIEKSNILLALMLTFLSGFVGFNINKVSTEGGNDDFSIALWILIGYLFFGVIYLISNIKPTQYMALGSQPNKIFVDFFFRPAVSNEERIIRLYVSEIERYQHRIDVNKEINEMKWKVYKKTIYILFGIPIVFLISFSILFKCT